MYRSGYSEDADATEWDVIRWRGAVASAIRGRRGQALLREMLAALDAMPEKRLIRGVVEKDGEVCALGSLGRARGLDMSVLSRYEDEDIHEDVARLFGIAPSLAAEIMWINDGNSYLDSFGYPAYVSKDTPEQRFANVRAWVASKIRDG